MSRTSGAKNYFDTKELYQLKDCVGYCKREGVTVPDSWKKNKLHRLAREWGIEPDYDNGVEGLGHHQKFGGRKMTTFSQKLVKLIRNERKEKRVEKVLPLEKMAKEAKREEKKAKADFVETVPVEETDPVTMDELFLEMANSAIAFGESMLKCLGRL